MCIKCLNTDYSSLTFYSYYFEELSLCFLGWFANKHLSAPLNQMQLDRAHIDSEMGSSNQLTLKFILGFSRFGSAQSKL